MSTSSTVGTVKARLVVLVGAALPGVQVSYAVPALTDLADESVWFAESKGRHEIAAIKAGRKSRREEFTVFAVVSVLDNDSAPDVVESRAMTLLAKIEDVLADSPKLGLAAGTIDWATASEFEVRVNLSTKGWLAEGRLGIDVTARLT